LLIVQCLFHTTLSRDLSTCKCVQYLMMLQAINAWETELKQHFLFFVTGSRRLPQPHTEVLRIELPFVAFDLKDHTIMLSRLPQVSHALRIDDDGAVCHCEPCMQEHCRATHSPEDPGMTCDMQAHTCENILELPNYLESLLAVHGQSTDSLLAYEMKGKLKSIIDDRLRFAITCCNSYGLDDRHAL